MYIYIYNIFVYIYYIYYIYIYILYIYYIHIYMNMIKDTKLPLIKWNIKQNS